MRAVPVGPALLVAAAVAIGVVLRLWNIRQQVLADDELHLVRAILRWRVPRLLTTYALADVGLPFGALFRFLLDRGWTLGEMHFRAPALVSGIATLVVLPCALSRRLPPPVLVAWAWLLAVWPSLVLYSRIARSYAPVTLLAALAVFAFAAWWESGRRRHAALYVLCGAAACWGHLATLPVVLSPLLVAAPTLLRRPRPAAAAHPRPLATVTVGAALAAGIAAFLLPALPSLLRLRAAKQLPQGVSLATAGEVFLLLAGTASPAFAVLFWAGVSAGAVLLVRRARGLAVFTVVAVVAQAVGIRLLSPKGIDHPVILHRYLLPIVPLLLLWAAVAVGDLWGGSPGAAGGTRWRRPLAVGLALLPLAAGPFLAADHWTSSLAHHNQYVRYSRAPLAIAADLVPAVYARLPSGPVLEYPWRPQWERARAVFTYARHHRRPVMVASPDYPRHPQLAFRNAVEPSPDAILASAASSVVVHLDVDTEEQAVAGGRARAIPRGDRRRYRGASKALVARLTAEWAEPDVRGTAIVAWNLERLRRGAVTTPRSGASPAPEPAPPPRRARRARRRG